MKMFRSRTYFSSRGWRIVKPDRPATLKGLLEYLKSLKDPKKNGEKVMKKEEEIRKNSERS